MPPIACVFVLSTFFVSYKVENLCSVLSIFRESRRRTSLLYYRARVYSIENVHNIFQHEIYVTYLLHLGSQTSVVCLRYICTPLYSLVLILYLNIQSLHMKPCNMHMIYNSIQYIANQYIFAKLNKYYTSIIFAR